MTQDQIRAIAEEYAHSVTDSYKKDPYISQSFIDDQCEELSENTEAFLKWLSVNGYCIVEREKVIEMYSSLKTPDYPCVDPKPTGVARIVMCNLFGASMFNQDETT